MSVKRKINFALKSLRVYTIYHLNKSWLFKKHNLRYTPFLVIVNPTNKCNLMCEYCNTPNVTDPHVLEYKYIKKIVDDCHRLKVPLLSFSGGEPMLHPNLIDAAKYVHDKNIMINLNTNGTLINERNVEDLAKYFDFIRVSLDGHEKTHDKICGVNGSYRKVVNALDMFSKIRHRNAKIGINFTISKHNRAEVNSVLAKFKKKVDFVSVIPQFRFVNPGFEDYLVNCEPKTITDQNISSKGLLGQWTLKKNKKECDAGILYLSIAANGSIIFCPFVNPKAKRFFVHGNVYKNSLRDCLRSNEPLEIDELRNYLNNTLPQENVDRLIEDNLVINNSKIVNLCSGCHATCTTEISNFFRLSPWRLPIEILEYIRRYRLI